MARGVVVKYVIDSSWWRRRSTDGETLVAGSPAKAMRLRAGATPLLDALEAGTDIADGVSDPIIDRLVDNGAIHPLPEESQRFHASDVTVVIPAHNESADVLGALVSSLSDVARVIIVDDGSTPPLPTIDGAEIVRRETSGGPGAARNTGLMSVTTALVLFVDADVTWDPDGWSTLLAHFDLDRIGAVAPRVASEPGPTVLARYEVTKSPLDLGAEPARVRARTRVSYVPAAALLARTNALRSISGFDENLRYGEDVDLVWRLDDNGVLCRYEPRVTVLHRPRRSFREAWRQRVGYGSAATGLHQRHPGHVAPLRVNRWSIAAWGALAAGHALVAVATTAGSIVLLARKLGNFSDRIPIAVRLAGLGNAHAGRLIASALTRTWWPITLIVCLVSKRARRVAAIAAVAPHLWSWLTERPDLDPIRYSLLGIADDVAYGTGVWKGAISARDAGALAPTID